MTSSDLKRLPLLLWVLSWGVVLHMFGNIATASGHVVGWKLGLITRTPGMLMIVWAVFVLSRIPVDNHDGKGHDGRGRYRRWMRLVSIVAVVGLLDTIHQHFAYDMPQLLEIAILLVKIAEVATIAVFCFAMRTFCLAAQWQSSARSWLISVWLFAVLLLAPVLVLNLADVLMLVTGETARIELGVIGITLLVGSMIPVFYFFVSVWQMMTAAQALAQQQVPVDPDRRLVR